MPESSELGRIKKNDTTEIVVQTSEFRGETGLDIREYVTTKTYTGFTKRGVRIPMANVEELKKLIAKA